MDPPWSHFSQVVTKSLVVSNQPPVLQTAAALCSLQPAAPTRPRSHVQSQLDAPIRSGRDFFYTFIVFPFSYLVLKPPQRRVSVPCSCYFPCFYTYSCFYSVQITGKMLEEQAKNASKSRILERTAVF